MDARGKFNTIIGYLSLFIGLYWIAIKLVFYVHFGHFPQYLIDPDPSSTNLVYWTMTLAFLFFLHLPVSLIWIVLIIDSLIRKRKMNLIEYSGILSFFIGLLIMLYFRFIDTGYFAWIFD